MLCARQSDLAKVSCLVHRYCQVIKSTLVKRRAAGLAFLKALQALLISTAGRINDFDLAGVFLSVHEVWG
ncbi:hypothetical protein H6F61_03100 [Cyanobacteria bacterium FACHB-472]|nr:hypothetical protein [Cyanobacteria bacterium FACHB-472]